MKYYFITYQATNKQGNMSTWNDVIDTSPMKFIKKVISIEENGSRTYNSFVVINALEITKQEYIEFKGQF